MSEPESLATEEGLSAHLRRHRLDRLIMVSDGIFAIAITLAAIEIHMPEQFTGFGELLHAMLRPVLGYMLAFFVTAIFWVSHRELFARLHSVDRVVTGLTLVLLAFVSLIPATVGGIYHSTHDEAGFQLWALMMIACGTANSALWIYAAAKPGLLVPDARTPDLWLRALMPAVMPAMFALLFVVPPYRAPFIAVPIGIVAGLFRRVLFPRLIARFERRGAGAR